MGMRPARTREVYHESRVTRRGRIQSGRTVTVMCPASCTVTYGPYTNHSADIDPRPRPCERAHASTFGDRPCQSAESVCLRGNGWSMKPRLGLYRFVFCLLLGGNCQ